MYNFNGKYWTEREITLLKKLYASAPREELLRSFPERSWNSITHKARRLGVKRRWKSWNKGKHLSEDHRRKISQANKGKGKIIIPEKELRELYIDKKLSTIKIAKLYGVSSTTVLARMDEYGIKRRSHSEASKGRTLPEEVRRKISKANKGKHYSPSTEFKKGHPPYFRPTKEIIQRLPDLNRKFYLSKSELSRLYLEKKLSVIQIAELLGVASTTVADWLRRYKIPRRSKAESTRLSWKRADYVKKQMKGRQVRPNKPEKKLIRILRENNFPFKYVGDGEVIIGYLCPDFIHNNGKKKVIELFGRTFHDPDKSPYKVAWHQQYWGRIAYYAQFGYDCLILWDDELEDEQRVVEKIRKFLEEDVSSWA